MYIFLWPFTIQTSVKDIVKSEIAVMRGIISSLNLLFKNIPFLI